METLTTPPAAERVDSASAWGEKGVHTVTCPSGAQVRVRIPNLPQLIKHDAVPESLRAAAIKEVSSEGVPAMLRQGLSEDEVKALYDLYEHLVIEMVVEPKLKGMTFGPDPENPEKSIVIDRGDIPSLPQEDVEMLVNIATRQQDTDALGVRLGVEPLNRWAQFREEHECPPGCEGCTRAIRRLSGSSFYGAD